MHTLFVSNLFPDRDETVRGLDNATLLHWLRETHGMEIRVLSPRPGFVPLSRLPRSEDMCFSPEFPRVSYVPRMGSHWNDHLMFRSLRASFDRAFRDFRPDIVLGSWLFPDGCALARLCEQAQIPLVLITQGSDTHQYIENALRRRKILEAVERSERVICRSGDLGARLARAGVPPDKLTVIYNGIDPTVFHPIDRRTAREQLNSPEESPILLFVGNLLPVKDPVFLLRAHACLNERRRAAGSPPARLNLIGQGPLESELRAESARLETLEFVDFLGHRTPAEVALHMNAADALCLSSINEGFPNVLLEAMACGLRIVSTDVGGIREKVDDPLIGELVAPGDATRYVEALERVLEPHPKNSTAPTPDLGWEGVADEYESCLGEAIRFATCRGN